MGDDMRRLKYLAALVAVAASALALGAAPALANNGKGAGTNFQVTYTFLNVTWTCSGGHVVNKNYTLDDETCIVSGDVSSAIPIGTSTGGTWLSDFSGPGWPFLTVPSQSLTLTNTPNGDGTYTIMILAYY
jgi:hypothetical protein